MKDLMIRSKLYDYEVAFTENFEEALSLFDDSTAYVIDQNVYALYRERLQAVDPARLYQIEATEGKKNMDAVMNLICFWKEIGVRKNWKVVCFGGGITQDITTIASNLYLRNIDWYFFPTTLLAMCDSCIGGKCGINFGPYKNQIGVFYPPKKIFIDTCFLNTISHMDYINGWGELLKFSLTSDPEFYRELKEEETYIPCGRIMHYIQKGLKVKKKIIEEDEFETDLRRTLNYGHTFGHALEAYTGNRIPHGMAVIWGIDVANYLAVQEGLIGAELYLDVKALIRRAFLQEEILIEDPDGLFQIIKTDKKVKGDTLSFAMLKDGIRLAIHPMKIDGRLGRMFKSYLEETHAYYCG